MLNRWGGWIILISFALVTTWLVRSLEEKFSKPSVSHPHVPDYTLQNFTSIQMDKHGRLKNKLTAKTMVHFPDTNTELTAPYMVFYKDEQPSWTVRAEQGEVSLNGEQLWLFGDTTLLRLASGQQKTMKIISQNVWVRLDTEYAETAAPTTIFTDNGKTYSIGMRVFMPTEQIDLLSQVRGHYALP